MKVSDLGNLTKDDILSMLGLAMKRRSTRAALMIGVECFALGLILGAGAGFLFAPKSGDGLREDLRDHLRAVRTSATEKLEEMTSRDHAPA